MAVPKPTIANEIPVPAIAIPTPTAATSGTRKERVADAEEQDADRHGPGVADPADQPGRADRAGDGTDALKRAQDAEEGGRPVQPLLEDGEDRGLDEADDEQGRGHREHDPAQARTALDVGDAGAELDQDVMLGRERPHLAQPQRAEARRRGEEGGGVQRRDGLAAHRRVEAGADERRDQA